MVWEGTSENVVVLKTKACFNTNLRGIFFFSLFSVWLDKKTVLSEQLGLLQFSAETKVGMGRTFFFFFFL